MLDLPGPLNTLVDLLVVIIGFGAIVFVHELGHFLAARWAGIRVLTFAVGFGPALVSWRKGLGWRRGSSQKEYEERAAKDPGSVSPTEYRLAALPFGGFVRMLGQDDMDPGAVSDAPDSYQQCKAWKRMVVISAGVVMNMIMAAVLFVLVFMVGMKVEPPIIGMIETGSAAEAARATLPDGTETSLEPGDRVISIDGVEPRRFDTILMEVATARGGRPIPLVVEREGVATALTFSITPEPSRATGLLDLGVGPAQSMKVAAGESKGERKIIARALEDVGLAGVEPGATLVRVNDQTDLRTPGDVTEAFERSGGRPVSLTFENPGGGAVTVESEPRPQFEVSKVTLRNGSAVGHTHLLGLAGVLMVHPDADAKKTKQGLKPGDVFARLGPLEYPSLPAGIEVIRENAGRDLDIEVLRPREGFAPERIKLTVHVKQDGTVGFVPSDTSEQSGLLSLPVERVEDFDRSLEPRTPAAFGVVTRPGTRLLAVNGTPVGTSPRLFESWDAVTKRPRRSRGHGRGDRVARAAAHAGRARGDARVVAAGGRGGAVA
ncbi:MAG: site-2 protease family protein [Phycisphaerales bacterium]